MRKIFTILMIVVLAACSASDSKYKADPSDVYASSSVEESKTKSGERMIAYSASVDLKIGDVDDAKIKITDQVKSIKGYLADESEKRITVQVPSTELDSFIEFLGDKVGTITDKSKHGNDITDSYDDTTAKLSTLKASRDQYMALLKKASAVDDILKIEKELERINTEIQRLETQKSRAEQSVNYSRVSIYLDDSTRGLLGWVFYGIGQALWFLF